MEGLERQRTAEGAGMQPRKGMGRRWRSGVEFGGPPVWNGNRFINEYPGADGVKIGYTEESQQTIVASATRGGRRIIAAVMRSQDRYTDAERVLDWSFAQPSACP